MLKIKRSWKMCMYCNLEYFIIHLAVSELDPAVFFSPQLPCATVYSTRRKIKFVHGVAMANLFPVSNSLLLGGTSKVSVTLFTHPNSVQGNPGYRSR